MFKGKILRELRKIIDETGLEAEGLKEAIDKLGTEGKFISSLLDTVPLFIVVIDVKGKVRRASRYMLDALGCTADEVLGKDYVSNFVPEKDREKVQALFDRLINVNEPVHTENYIISKDGTEILVEWCGASVSDSNRVQFFFGAGIDLSQKEQSKAALRESEEKYRELFEMVSDAIFLIDNETGRILAVNPAASVMYGYGREELLRMDHTQVSAEAQDTRRATLEYRSTVPLRYHRKKDGTVFPVEITASHFKYMNREVHIAAIRDITFRMEAEEEKKQFDAKLQQSQKMEAIGTLTGGIAHDFNNILGGIMGYTEVAKINLPEDSPVHHDLEEVLKAADRAKKLVGQILEFSRGLATELRPLRISGVVKEALKFIRPVLPATVEIQQHLNAKDDVVMADPTHIHQVLMNLFTNATHAMGDKGGKLTVTLSEVDFSVDRPLPHPDLRYGPHILLSVADTGCGIPPEIMPRIFDPYFTTKEKGKGTGLGLAVVDGIVRKHGGGIVVESEPGEGAAFQIYLPMVQKQPIQRIEKTKEILPAGHEKILFVDDEAILTDISSRLLMTLGYDVVTRTSSLEALELFRNKPETFDIVITDQLMPNMTGLDLAMEIISIRPDIPIILCTGFGDFATDEQAKKLGIREILKKPVSRNDLARALKKVLESEQ
ncbi:MAG: PAS domain S-box protein [Syntrophaceae bacterium]|nr:PAS domain S-box protein [Syntrophaceae bacterium]